MKKLWRLAILLSLVSFIVQGCNDNDEPDEVIIREKPASQTRLLGPNEGEGEIAIELDEWQDVLIISGPGSFISAIVSKTGGNSADLSKSTIIRLRLDRKEVSLKSFEVARAMGLSEQNYSGIVWLQGVGNVETMVLGYSQPLYFSGVLVLSVKVDDPGVEKIFLSVTFTREDTGEDEDTGGGDSEVMYP